MDFSRDELKEMVGKRVTIDGDRHRVAKVSLRDKTITTNDGVTIDCEGIYKRGRGFFYDTPKKTRNSGKTPKADTAEIKTPKNVKRDVKAEPVKKKIEREPKGKKAKKAAPFAFDQNDTEALAKAVSELVREHLPEMFPSLQLGIHGAVYNTDVAVVTLGFAPAGLSQKQVRALYADRAELSEVMHADEADEEDDMSDLDDDEEEEADDELDDSFEEDDEEEDDDEGLEEDDDEEEADDEEEDDEEEDDDEEADVSEVAKKLLAKLRKASPNSNHDLAHEYIIGFLESEEVDEVLGDELIPGQTVLLDGGKRFLLAGYDSEGGVIRMINLANGKFRSRELKDVVRMEYE